MDGVTRREFLKWAGLSGAGAVAFSACGVPERALFIQSTVAIPEDLATSNENWYATTCDLCGAGEGILVRVVEGKAKKVEGNPNHPVNRGKTSARCQAQVQSLYHPDRIIEPMVRQGFLTGTARKEDRGNGNYGTVSWDDAIKLLADRLRTSGRDGLLITNPVTGALGGVAQRFATATGLRHMALEPLEQTTVRRAVRDVFGVDRMPTFDVARASTVLSFGANWLSTWMSSVHFSVGYGAFRGGSPDARRPRGYFVHAEPRFSLTAANADRWLPVNPGWEGVLALSIANALQALGMASPFGDLSRYNPEAVANDVGVSADWIRETATQLRDHRPSVVIGGGSAAAHTNGLFNMRAVYGLNVMLGNLGKEGGVLFNPGAPIDGLVAEPAVTTLKDWKTAAADLGGRAKVALVRRADPVHALAAIDFRRALLNADFIVSFTNVMDDTTALADLILPETDGLEQWGIEVPRVGPGYQVVTFQQPVVRPDPQQDPRAFGDVLLQTANVMGRQADFPLGNMRDVTQSLARQLFDLKRGFPDRQPDAPSFWNATLAAGGWWDVNNRAQVPTVARVDVGARRDPQSQGATGADSFALVPFAHNTLDDGRLAHLPWLQHTPDPTTTAAWQTWVEMNIDTAKDLGLTTNDIIELAAPNGRTTEAIVYVSPAVPRRVLAAPVAYGFKNKGRYAEGRGVNIFEVLAPAEDADTGAFAWAATRVTVRRTGQRRFLPVFEGRVTPVRQLEEDPVVLVVDASGKDATASEGR